MQYLNKSKNNSGEIHLLELIRSSSISLQPAWAGLEPNYTVALHLTCEDYWQGESGVPTVTYGET